MKVVKQPTHLPTRFLPIDRNDALDTSFFDTTIRTSVAKLRKVLGEPDCVDNTGEDKVNFEWMRKFIHKGRTIIFTVYDYKEYRRLSERTIVEWHIGGFNREETNLAVRAMVGEI